MTVSALVGLAAATVIDPAPSVLAVGAITVVPVALAAASAAAFAVVLGAPNLASNLQLSFPEAATIGLILRQAFPPALVAAAVAPVVAARVAVQEHGDPFGVSLLAALPAIAISIGVIAFLRSRRSVVF